MALYLMPPRETDTDRARRELTTSINDVKALIARADTVADIFPIFLHLKEWEQAISQLTSLAQAKCVLLEQAEAEREDDVCIRCGRPAPITVDSWPYCGAICAIDAENDK